jgi:hypothetical protein
MTARAFDLRVRRLERARRPDGGGVFFLAMGRGDVEIEAAISATRANLTLQSGDTVVRLKWAGAQKPASRWIVSSLEEPRAPGALTKTERAALDLEIDRLRESIAPRLREFRPGMGPQYSGLDQMSDEQLIARILGKALA